MLVSLIYICCLHVDYAALLSAYYSLADSSHSDVSTQAPESELIALLSLSLSQGSHF